MDTYEAPVVVLRPLTAATANDFVRAVRDLIGEGTFERREYRFGKQGSEEEIYGGCRLNRFGFENHFADDDELDILLNELTEPQPLTRLFINYDDGTKTTHVVTIEKTFGEPDAEWSYAITDQEVVIVGYAPPLVHGEEPPWQRLRAYWVKDR